MSDCLIVPVYSATMAGMVGEDLPRLAKAVVRRRVELGYKTREDFAAAVGLSVRTLGDIERARRLVGDSSVAAVETALGWKLGSFEAILDCREPELVESAKVVPEPDRADAIDQLVGSDPDLRAIWTGLQAIAQLTEQERIHTITLVKALRGTAGAPARQRDVTGRGGGNRHAG